MFQGPLWRILALQMFSLVSLCQMSLVTLSSSRPWGSDSSHAVRRAELKCCSRQKCVFETGFESKPSGKRKPHECADLRGVRLLSPH